MTGMMCTPLSLGNHHITIYYIYTYKYIIIITTIIIIVIIINYYL